MKITLTTTKGRYVRFDKVEQLESPHKLGSMETKEYIITLKNGDKHHFPEIVVEEIEVSK